MDEETLLLGQKEFDRLETIEKLKKVEKDAIINATDDSIRDIILNSTTF